MLLAEPVWPAPLLLVSFADVLTPSPEFILPLFDEPLAALPPCVDLLACCFDFDLAFGCGMVSLLAACPSVPLMLSCVLLATVPEVAGLPMLVWAEAKLVALARMAAAIINLRTINSLKLILRFEISRLTVTSESTF